jgi:transcriptional regulator with XRE-family HTH domain
MNGTDLKIARIKAGLKQYEFAQLLGIPQARVSEYENDHREPSPEILQKILTIFNEKGITLPQEGSSNEASVLSLIRTEVD